MNTLSRRTFLAATAAVGLGAEVLGNEDSPKIIDTHQHLWDRKKLQIDWIAKGSVLDTTTTDT